MLSQFPIFLDLHQTPPLVIGDDSGLAAELRLLRKAAPIVDVMVSHHAEWPDQFADDSGCINACAHHHAADIGVLGVNKKGVEHFQITLGGKAGEAAQIGKILGPSNALKSTREKLKMQNNYLKHAQEKKKGQ